MSDEATPDPGAGAEELRGALLRASERNRELQQALAAGEAAAAERIDELEREMELLRHELRRRHRRIDHLKQSTRNDRMTLRRIRASLPYRVYAKLRGIPGVPRLLGAGEPQPVAPDRLVADTARERGLPPHPAGSADAAAAPPAGSVGPGGVGGSGGEA